MDLRVLRGKLTLDIINTGSWGKKRKTENQLLLYVQVQRPAVTTAY